MIVHAEDGRIEAAAVAAKGMRAYMEDAHALLVDETGALIGGVFDGHLGNEVADLAAARLADIEPGQPLADWLRQIHEEAGHIPDIDAGACAVLFRIDGELLELANLGDAEMALVSESGKVQVLTELHRLSNASERARVLACGAQIGHVRGVETYAMDPQTGKGLQPTRCLGDHDFEHLGVVCQPYEARHHFSEGWLVAACDGLWDVIKPDALPGLLQEATSAELAAHRLALAAFDCGTQDNLTVLVVRCRERGSEPALRAPSASPSGDQASLRRQPRTAQAPISRTPARPVRGAR